MVVALVVCVVATVLAEKAVLEMKDQLSHSGVVAATLRTGECERTALIMLIELRQARKYVLAAFALKMIAFEVLCECGLIRAIEVTAWLQAMLVFLPRSALSTWYSG